MGLARVAGLEQPRGKILLAPSCQYRRSGRILPLPWFRACRSRAFPPGTVQSELHSPHSGHPIPDPGGPFRSAALNDGRHLPPLHKPAASTRRGLTLSLSLSLSLLSFFLSLSLLSFFLSPLSLSLSLSSFSFSFSFFLYFSLSLCPPAGPRTFISILDGSSFGGIDLDLSLAPALISRNPRPTTTGIKEAHHPCLCRRSRANLPEAGRNTIPPLRPPPLPPCSNSSSTTSRDGLVQPVFLRAVHVALGHHVRGHRDLPPPRVLCP